jgi:hypothetical protein
LLVTKLPEQALEIRREAEPGDPDENPFCAFWEGDDPRLHAELCTVLDDRDIPHKTVYRKDHLFNTNRYRAFQIGVPFSDFEKAENAVKDAFQTDQDGSREILMLPAAEEVQGQNESYREPVDGRPASADEPDLEAWNGEPAEITDMVRDSLKENLIEMRWEEMDGQSRLFVRRQDADRAREIVREILEAAPPE